MIIITCSMKKMDEKQVITAMKPEVIAAFTLSLTFVITCVRRGYRALSSGGRFPSSAQGHITSQRDNLSAIWKPIKSNVKLGETALKIRCVKLSIRSLKFVSDRDILRVALLSVFCSVVRATVGQQKENNWNHTPRSICEIRFYLSLPLRWNDINRPIQTNPSSVEGRPISSYASRLLYN